MLKDFENKIINIDCFEFMKQLPDGCVDLIVTDPPYFIQNLKTDLGKSDACLRRSSNSNVFCAEWDSDFKDVETYQAWFRNLLINLKRILRDKAQVYMFFNYEHIHWAEPMIQELGFKFYKYLIWYKPDTMGLFPNQYGCNYEMILWFRKQGDTGAVVKHIGCGQRDVFTFNSTSNRKEGYMHPTIKPRPLVRKLIMNGSNEGDLIFDPFSGSGTTAAACSDIYRRFIACERDQVYYDNSLKRIRNIPQKLSDFNEKV